MSDTQTPKMVTIMPDYINSTINYSTFKIILAAILVVLIILLLGAMLGGGFAANQLQIINLNKKYDMSRYKKTNLSPTLHGEFAAVKSGSFPHKSNGTDFTTKESCENVDYRTWDSDLQKCMCKVPYWGTSCQRETNGVGYLSMGQFEACGKLDILGEYLVNNKSFPFENGYETCQQHCDNDDRCVGFIYNEMGDRNRSEKVNQCITLESEPTGDVRYDLNQDGNLYLRKDRSTLLHKMPHKLFLIKGNPPRRFWMEPQVRDGTYAITEIGFNKAHRMDFIPSMSINHSEAPIVFSVKHFDVREAKRAIDIFRSTGNHPEGMFVHIPGVNDLVLPYMWVSNDYWVMAVSDKQVELCVSTPSLSRSGNTYSDGFSVSREADQTLYISDELYEMNSSSVKDCDSDYRTLSASRPDADETMFKSEWSL